MALCADTGRNYLSKCFDDHWLAANKLMLTTDVPHSIGDLLKNRGPRELVTISPKSTVSDAIGLLQSTGFSQIPVLEDGKSVGSIQEVTLARSLHDHSDPDAVPVGDVMGRPLPQLESTVHLDEAYRLLLAGNTGVLAVQDGEIIDIVTRIDLVQYWNQMRIDKTQNAKKRKKTKSKQAG